MTTTDLGLRVDLLESQREIERLISCYAHAFDLHDVDMLRGIWHDDAELRLGDPFGPYPGTVPATLFERTGQLLVIQLEQAEQWRTEFHPGTGCRFGGRFLLSRSDRSGIPAIDNLGSHLLAIREYAVPSSIISEIRCSYELPDERLVWIDKGNQRVASIDLLAHGQPIIQRFIQKVEAALDGAAFPFDLEFALRVARELHAVQGRGAS